ncbi:hypothetical protein SAMD00019534_108710 [Acytostelium subglobosum LB1]|uniref:hypothetical protein n=1 Tax=Acytostelium subglobosum LB1 TaxID=1410327 RepID=UPI000644B65B|nr:hypothetical protein SAMD00019534_108710 [Acytostelium subglobosum LB1]GAM27695.1 hypothetical protein SAMD00019534_108710 [Acytostelium subglobosum LB1]|eukprot:XP_012749354.1 hypothetical protein SAMD00019534_108710 [Acytostelium subglobosum LB1]
MSLEQLIKSPVSQVSDDLIKYVYANNQLMFSRSSLLIAAVASGRVEVYKLLKCQKKPVSFDDILKRQENSRVDYLLIAMEYGRLAMFEYLLQRQNKHDWDQRVATQKETHQYGVPISQNVDIDWKDVASMIRLLMPFIEQHNQRGATGSTTKMLIRDYFEHSFYVLLKCQDVELARQAINHIDFDLAQFKMYCDEVFRPTVAAPLDPDVDVEPDPLLDILYRDSSCDTPTSDDHIRQSFKHLLDILVVYGKQSWIDKSQALAQSYRSMFDQPHTHDQMDIILKTLIKNDGLATICTYGTVEMLERAHYLINLPECDHPVSHHPQLVVYPKSSDITRYIKLHRLFNLSKTDTLYHCAAMGDLDSIKFYLDTYPIQSALDHSVNDEPRYRMITSQSFDKVMDIQSMLYPKFDHLSEGDNRLRMLDCLDGCTSALTLSHVKMYSDEALQYMKFCPRPGHGVIDQEVIKHLLGINIDKPMFNALLLYVFGNGLKDIILWMEDSYPDALDRILETAFEVAPLLHKAFINGHYHITDYILGKYYSDYDERTWTWIGLQSDLFYIKKIFTTRYPTGDIMLIIIRSACSVGNDQVFNYLMSNYNIKFGDFINDRANRCLFLDRVDMLETLVKHYAVEMEDSMDDPITTIKHSIIKFAQTRQEIDCPLCMNYLLDGMDSKKALPFVKHIPLVRHYRGMTATGRQ